MWIRTVILLFLFNWSTVLMSQPRHRVDKSTDYLVFVPAVVGTALSLSQKDYKGFSQFALSSVTSIGANYLLESIIKKDRPDKSGSHSFPSTHATVACTGAAFVQRRYGWKWGLPMYLISAYVDWGRIYSKKHDVWDVLAGSLIGVGSSYLYTRPFSKKINLVVSPSVMNNKPGLYLSAQF